MESNSPKKYSNNNRIHKRTSSEMRKMVAKAKRINTSVCWICAKEFQKNISFLKPTADHLVSVDINSPLAVAHFGCNSRRSGKKVGNGAIQNLFNNKHVIKSISNTHLRKYFNSVTNNNMSLIDRKMAETVQFFTGGEIEEIE